jgi:predicted PurR-regulated permease PerM
MPVREPNPDFLVSMSRGLIWRLVIVAGVLLLFFYAGKFVLVAIAGIFVAIILRGAANYIQRFSFVKPQWSYPMVLGAIVVAVAGIGFALGPRVITQAHEIARTVPGSLGHIQAQLQRYQWGRELTQLLSRSMQSQEATARATEYGRALVTALVDGIIIAAIGAYLASNPRWYRSGVLQLLPGKYRAKAADLFDDIASVVRGWLMGQLIPMAVLGIGTLIGLAALGVHLAFTLALFTAIMLFVPYVGSVIAYIPTVLIAFTQSPMKAVYVTILYLGVHIGEGYIVTPLAQRHAVRLPPALTLLNQFFMWEVAGLFGVLIAAPLAAVCIVTVNKLYLKREPHLRGDFGSDGTTT